MLHKIVKLIASSQGLTVPQLLNKLGFGIPAPSVIECNVVS